MSHSSKSPTGSAKPSDIDKLGQLLHRFMGLVHERSTGETLVLMHEQGLTLPQIVVLHRLHDSPQVGLHELTRCVSLSASATSVLVDKLVERGLCARWEHPDDRRQRVVGPTEAGRAFIERLNHARSQELAHVFVSVDPEVRRQAAHVFATIIAQLESKS